MSLDLNDRTARLSYALAINVAESLRQMPVELNMDVIGKALPALLTGGHPEMDETVYRASMQELQQDLQKAAQTQHDKAAAANVEAEKAFLSENAKKPGVVTTASGLQYLELKAGTGDTPKANNVVKVHYEGKLLDGNVFDSSIRRGEPAEFPVNQVIAGWTEALQLMKVGGKARLFIPAKLAYGERGAGAAIPPNCCLVFEVELLDIVR